MSSLTLFREYFHVGCVLVCACVCLDVEKRNTLLKLKNLAGIDSCFSKVREV